MVVDGHNDKVQEVEAGGSEATQEVLDQPERGKTLSNNITC